MTRREVPKNRKVRILNSLTRLFALRKGHPPELQRGIELLRAIDAGGIPLNPAIINRIARDLGLDVSSSAATDLTISRIRAAVKRGLQTASMERDSR